MPPMQKRSNRKNRRRRLRSANLRRRNVGISAQALRRHSSFHTVPVPMTGSPPQEPSHGRHVSFDLGTTTSFRSSGASPRKSSSMMSPFSLQEFLESPESLSRQSSESSVTLPFKSSLERMDALHTHCYDVTCECQPSPLMTSIELDMRPLILPFIAYAYAKAREAFAINEECLHHQAEGELVC